MSEEVERGRGCPSSSFVVIAGRFGPRPQRAELEGILYTMENRGRMLADSPAHVNVHSTLEYLGGGLYRREGEDKLSEEVKTTETPSKPTVADLSQPILDGIRLAVMNFLTTDPTQSKIFGTSNEGWTEELRADFESHLHEMTETLAGYAEGREVAA